MIWPDEEHDSARQLQKKLEYAKELELQIEVRRAHQREEQLELEELERKFQPDDRSLAKWLIDGGYSAPVVQHPDFASYHSPFRFPQQQQFQGATAAAGQTSPLPPSAGEPSGAPSVGRDDSTSSGAPNSHTRFRITDLQEQSDRLRERTQQLEWKRVLDEQVRENTRLKQQEEDERRRDEAGSVREEMMFLRDQQLAAQRRMGFPVMAASHQSPAYGSASAGAAPARNNFGPVDDHPVSEYQQQYPNYAELLRNNGNTYGATEPLHRADQGHYRQQYDAPDAISMPPPAPSRFNSASSPPHNFRESASSQQQFQGQHQQQQQQSNDSFSDSRNLIISEYRSLLAEIRREREEVRQEKEELRQEKEQLRLERALLQLENEKMASYVDAQRRLNDQQLEMQRQETFRQPPQQQQQQPSVSSAYPSPMREYYQAPPPSVQRPQRPPAFDLSQINQMERSIAAMGLGNRSVRETRPPERRPSPISMDDFAIPQNRRTPNVVDSPRFKRLSQFRFQPAAHEQDDMNALDQSLIGESVFVALSPEEVSSAASRGPPRITETTSPRRGERPDNQAARNELRNSRVIKSRGFYNIESEANAFPARAAAEAAKRRHAAERKKKKKSSDTAAHRSPSRMPPSAEKSRHHEKAARRFGEYETSSKAVPFTQSSSAVDTQQKKTHKQQQQRQFASSSATVGHNDGGNGSEDDDESELSRSLFQVKVLV
ncbi:hypothetical protein Gpo141_00001772 [Globisporangium polare]